MLDRDALRAEPQPVDLARAGLAPAAGLLEQEHELGPGRGRGRLGGSGGGGLEGGGTEAIALYLIGRYGSD